jgi:hypothetical protein
LIGWVVDDAIRPQLEQSNLPEVLWAVKLVWPRITGIRRLVVRELEVWTSGAAPRSREVFSNVIEL